MGKGANTDFTKIPLLSGLAARLEFLAARTTVIVDNIVNADTPCCVAKDIKSTNFKTLAEAALPLRINNPKHIACRAQRRGRS